MNLLKSQAHLLLIMHLRKGFKRSQKSLEFHQTSWDSLSNFNQFIFILGVTWYKVCVFDLVHVLMLTSQYTNFRSEPGALQLFYVRTKWPGNVPFIKLDYKKNQSNEWRRNSNEFGMIFICCRRFCEIATNYTTDQILILTLICN